MAKKTAAKRAGSRRAGAKRAAGAGHDGSAILEAALELAAARGWGQVSLADVAEAAGVRMSELYARYPTKQAILDGLARHVDHEVLRTVDDDPPEGNARERLFDLLMRRFDVLDRQRDGVRAVVRQGLRDPVALICGACALRRSMAVMLEAAGISSTGLLGTLRIKGLAAAYLAAMRAWLGDDSPDKARTMAALDRALARLDGWATMVERLGRRPERRQAA